DPRPRALEARHRAPEPYAEVAAADLDVGDVRLRDRARAIRYVAALQRQNRWVGHGDVVGRTAEHGRWKGGGPLGAWVEESAAVVGHHHARASQIADRAADRELPQRAGNHDVDDIVIC